MSIAPISTLPPIDSPAFTERVTDEFDTLRQGICDPRLTYATFASPDEPTPFTRADLAFARLSEKLSDASEMVQRGDLTLGEINDTMDASVKMEADLDVCQAQVDELGKNLPLVDVEVGTPEEAIDSLQTSIDEAWRSKEELDDVLEERADEL